MIPIDPLTATIGFLCWMAFRKQSGTQFGQMTAEREEVFNNAMQFLTDPNRLNNLAEEFQKEGLKVQAFLMHKRAEWRARPPEVQQEHNKIFDKAMKSENIKAILNVAKSFEVMTATIKAKQLREHAKAIHQADVAKKQEEVNLNKHEETASAAPLDISQRIKQNGAAHPIVEEKPEPMTELPAE